MSRIAAALYRRSPHLGCYWRGAGLVVKNYSTGGLGAAPPLACEVLDFFNDWRSIDALLSARPPSTHRHFRTLLGRLVGHTLLQRSDRSLSGSERAMDSWAPWNPAAGFFHAATKDVPFIDM